MKMKLELDALLVESFVTGGNVARGTIKAYGDGDTVSGCITGVLLNCPYTPNCPAVETYPSEGGSAAAPYSNAPQPCATPPQHTGRFDFNHQDTCGYCFGSTACMNSVEGSPTCAGGPIVCR